MGQEYQENQNKQIELFPFDPIVVIWDVLKRWYLILAVAILAGMAAFVGTELTYRPNYTTTTTFVVSAERNSATVYQNLSATSSLASVFSEVLNSSILRESILKDVGIASFDGSIQATAVAETNLITVQVTGSDPRTTFLVTRSIIENHDVVSYQVMGDTILEVLQKPAVPISPSNPMEARGNMKKAVLLSAAAMCVLLGVHSFLRDTVRSKKETEEKTGERVLCELHHEWKRQDLKDFFKRRKGGILITNPATSFAYVEMIRKLRRQVEQHMPEDGRVLLVTSVLENEGKSTIAVNLALSLAQKYKKVLLIDGDFRRPSCGKILEQAGRGASTSDVVHGRASLDQAAVPCARMERLHVLLEFGKQPDTAVEMSGSEGMAALLRKAREVYDFVIIDTAPMAVGADAECMAELVDASLLVARQNVAAASAINQELDVLHEASSKMLGVVLNNVYTPALSEASSYGYGDGYGYGYSRYGKYGAYHRMDADVDEVGKKHGV